MLPIYRAFVQIVRVCVRCLYRGALGLSFRLCVCVCVCAAHIQGLSFRLCVCVCVCVRVLPIYSVSHSDYVCVCVCAAHIEGLSFRLCVCSFENIIVGRFKNIAVGNE